MEIILEGKIHNTVASRYIWVVLEDPPKETAETSLQGNLFSKTVCWVFSDGYNVLHLLLKHILMLCPVTGRVC